MSDRRNRPIVRCSVPSCVSAGHWQASRGLCPTHYRELLEQTRAAVARALDPDPAFATGKSRTDPPLSTVLDGPTEGVHT